MDRGCIKHGRAEKQTGAYPASNLSGRQLLFWLEKKEPPAYTTIKGKRETERWPTEGFARQLNTDRTVHRSLAQNYRMRVSVLESIFSGT